MISYDSKECWDEFCEIWSKDKNNIIIDLRECSSKREFVLSIGSILRASYSTKVEVGSGISIDAEGGNLDALSDVMSDWFIENWNNWKDIYIVGWQGFIDKHPVYSQKLALTLTDSYILSITAQMRAVLQWKEEECADMNFLDAMYENPPRVFLIMN